MNKFQKELMEFSKGEWTLEPPTTTGDFHVCTRDGYYAGVRTIVRLEDGCLYDTRSTSMTAVEDGKVSSWRGYWWSVPIPSMPPCRPQKMKAVK